MHGDPVAERGDQTVAVDRGHAAEVGHDLPALQRVDQRRALREGAAEAVEIRKFRLEVILEALAAPVRAGDVLDQTERPGAEHIAHGKQRVLLQLRGAVDAVERIAERIDQRAVRPLQPEDCGERIGRLDGVDVGDEALPHRDHALRWIADAVVARLHVCGGERRAVVEFHVRMELEGVGPGILGNRPALREVADEPGIVGRVDLEQVRVVRRQQMDDREQRRLMAVVGRRVARVDAEHQGAAAHGFLCRSR